MKKLQDMLNSVFKALLFYGRFFKLRRKIADFKRRSPGLFRPLDQGYEKQHVQLWRPLARTVNASWLRFYTNVSGIKDHMYVPEDIYYAVIERRLNDSVSTAIDKVDGTNSHNLMTDLHTPSAQNTILVFLKRD